MGPAGGQPPGVLGAVRVPYHDLLPPSIESAQVGGYVEQLLHGRGRVVEVIQRLKEGHHVQRPLHTCVALQQKDRQDDSRQHLRRTLVDC